MLNRRRWLQAASAGVAAAAWPGLSCSRLGEQLRDEGWNVLFLIADDLNDWVSFLGGHPAARTPNLDRLAAKSTVFTNAHCASPCCGGSRTSVMLGLDPTTTGIYSNHQDYAETRPEAATLPLHFKRNGYWTGSTGKVFHVPEQHSWSERFTPETEDESGFPRVSEGGYGFGQTRFDWGPVEASADRFHDWRIGDWAIEQLAQERQEPFFLAAGFGKPHLPWMVPQEYFEPFPPAEVQLPVARPIADRRDIPSRARALATHARHRLIVGSGQWEKGVSSYLACTYFVDAMIGRVLEALQRSAHAERTIVVFWSDHGFHLGEKSHWGKFALWEESTRVPLTVSIPGRDAALCHRPVSLTSLFPTLAQLCGLAPVAGLDGASLVPLLEDPAAAWERPAVTTLAPGAIAVRDERWRYIRYGRDEELYDHSEDPDEWQNLAGEAGSEAAEEPASAGSAASGAGPEAGRGGLSDRLSGRRCECRSVGRRAIGCSVREAAGRLEASR